MKFKVGDKVLITAGKDKGKTGEISQVLPKENKVVIPGINQYVKHVKPMPMINRPGEKVTLNRPLSVAKIAIINDGGEPDRIGYKIDNQGKKSRIFRKTGQEVPEPDLQVKENEEQKSAQDQKNK